MRRLIDWFNIIIKKRKELKRWKRIVMALAAMITFATTYALILPAITVERDNTDVVAGMYLNEQVSQNDLLMENAPAPVSYSIAADQENAVTFAYADDDMTATAVFSTDEEIPEGTELVVNSVDPESGEYAELSSRSAGLLDKASVYDVTTCTFYDFALVCDNVDVTPKTGLVDIQIVFSNNTFEHVNDVVYLGRYAKPTEETDGLVAMSADIENPANDTAEEHYAPSADHESSGSENVPDAEDELIDVNADESPAIELTDGIITVVSLKGSDLARCDSIFGILAGTANEEIGTANEEITEAAETDAENPLNDETQEENAPGVPDENDDEEITSALPGETLEVSDSDSIAAPGYDETDGQSANSVITAGGESYFVSVTYGEDAQIPVGAWLYAQEILPQEKEFENLYNGSVEAAFAEADSIGIDQPLVSGVRLFDIEIRDVEGHKVNPAVPVDVSIRLADMAEAEHTTVVHFANRSAETLEVSKSEDREKLWREPKADVSEVKTRAKLSKKSASKTDEDEKAEDKASETRQAEEEPQTVTEVCFAAPSFSVYSVVQVTNLAEVTAGGPWALVSMRGPSMYTANNSSTTQMRYAMTEVVSSGTHSVAGKVVYYDSSDADKTVVGGDVSEWFIEKVQPNNPNDYNYYVYTETGGTRQYLTANTGNNTVGLSTTAGDSARFRIDVTNNKIYLRPAADPYKRVTNTGNNPSGFSLSYNTGDDTLFMLGRLDPLYEEQTAKKVSAADWKGDTNYGGWDEGSTVIIYRRVENADGSEALYALATDGTYVPVYDGGDTIYYHNPDGKNLNWHVWYDDKDGYHIANYDGPDSTSNNTIHISPSYSTSDEHPWSSSSAKGLTMTGMANDYGTTIRVWDQGSYAYAGLDLDEQHPEDGAAAGIANDLDEFLFAVVGNPLISDGQLHPVNTVNSTDLGITMKVYNYTVTSSNTTYNSGYRNPFMQSVMGNDMRSDWDGRKYRVTPMVEGKLGSDGYPVSLTAGSLADLFTAGDYSYDSFTSTNGWETVPAGTATVTARDANHLFLQSYYDESKTFRYSSMENFAHFNSSGTNSGDFTVYRETGTPNLPTQSDHYYYYHGHFMPFNTLNPNLSVSRLVDQYGNTAEKENARAYENVYALTETPDYYTGLSLEATFVQPSDGTLENGDPVIYRFTGDDDLWVYIDGILVLDVSGIHEPLTGSINFKTGDVYQPYYYGEGTTGTPHHTDKKIYDIFYEAYLRGDISPEKWNEMRWADVDGDDKPDTFADFSTHTFNMFYLERGAGASNLDLQFNLKVVKSNEFTVEKKLPEGINPRYVNQTFRYRATYIDDHGDEQPLFPGCPDGHSDGICTEVYYMGRTNPDGTLKKDPVTVDEDGYFTLQAGEGAVFVMTDNSIVYNVREVGIDENLIERVDINSELNVTIKTDDPDTEEYGRYAEAGEETVKKRSYVVYTNHPFVQKLLITKHIESDSLPDEPGVTPVFEFRVYVESNADLDGNPFGTDGSGNPITKLIPYALGPYYVTKEIDGVTHYYQLTGPNNSPVDVGTVPTVCSDTGRSGSINSIPKEYTIVIPNLAVGTHFYVEERRDNLPGGYAYVRELLTPGTYDPETMYSSLENPHNQDVIDRVLARDEKDYQVFDPSTIGKIKKGKDAESHIYNIRPPVSIPVKKVWNPAPVEGETVPDVTLALIRYSGPRTHTPAEGKGAIHISHNGLYIDGNEEYEYFPPEGFVIEYTITRTDGGQNEVVVGPTTSKGPFDLDPGTYKVTAEVTNQGVQGNYVYNRTTSAVNVKVDAGETEEVMLQSIFERHVTPGEESYITISHASSGLPDTTELPSGFEATYVAVNRNGRTYTFTGPGKYEVDPGTYNITVIVGSEGQTPLGYARGETPEVRGVVVETGQDVPVAFTTTYNEVQIQDGTISVSHKTSGLPGDPAFSGSATYTIKDANGVVVRSGLRMTDFPVTVSPGTYTVSANVSYGNAPDNYIYNHGTAGETTEVTVGNGEDVTAELTSAYASSFGNTWDANLRFNKHTNPNTTFASGNLERKTVQVPRGGTLVVTVRLSGQADIGTRRWSYGGSFENNSEAFSCTDSYTDGNDYVYVYEINNITAAFYYGFHITGPNVNNITYSYTAEPRLESTGGRSSAPRMMRAASAPAQTSLRAAGGQTALRAAGQNTVEDISPAEVTIPAAISGEIPAGYTLDTTYGKRIVLSGGDWREVLEQQQLLDNYGNFYYYAIVELDVPEGYTLSYTNNPVSAEVLVNTTSVDLTATNTKKTGSLEVVKAIAAGSDQNTDETFYLKVKLTGAEPSWLRLDGAEISSEIMTYDSENGVTTIILPYEGAESHTITGITVGATYTVTELTDEEHMPENWKQKGVAVITGGDHNYIIAADETETATITNEQTTRVDANKVWDGGEEPRPTIYFRLFYKVNIGSVQEPIYEYYPAAGQDVLPLESGVTSVHWDGVPIWMNETTQYTYIVKEYIEGDENHYDYSDGNGHYYIEAAPEDYLKIEDGLTITNRRTEDYNPTTSYTGTKVWLDPNDKTRPGSLLLTLMIDDGDGDRTNDEPALNAQGQPYGYSWTSQTGDTWRYTFGELPVFDEDGNPIQYYVKETQPTGYIEQQSTVTPARYDKQTSAPPEAVDNDYTFQIEGSYDLPYVAIQMASSALATDKYNDANHQYVYHVWTARTATPTEKADIINLLNNSGNGFSNPAATMDDAEHGVYGNTRFVSGLPVSEYPNVELMQRDDILVNGRYTGYKVNINKTGKSIHMDVNRHEYFQKILCGKLSYEYTSGSTELKNKRVDKQFNARKQWIELAGTPPTGAEVIFTLLATIPGAEAGTTISLDPEDDLGIANAAITLNGTADYTQSNEELVHVDGEPQNSDAYEDTAWHAHWANLPEYYYDNEGKPHLISYSMTETSYKINGRDYTDQPGMEPAYTTDSDGETGIVTNNIPDKVISAKKRWPANVTSNDIPEGTKVAFTLTAKVNGQPMELSDLRAHPDTDPVPPDTVVLDGHVTHDAGEVETDETLWEYTWSSLLWYYNRVEVEYTVEEAWYEIAGIRYTPANADTAPPAGYDFSFTNELPTVEIEADKTWKNSKGEPINGILKNAEATFELYANTGVNNTPVRVTVDAAGQPITNPVTITVTGDSANADAWKAYWSNLPKYKEGSLIEYSVFETSAFVEKPEDSAGTPLTTPTGFYTVTFTDQEHPDSGTAEIVNTLPSIDVTVHKTWGAQGVWPDYISVEMMLKQIVNESEAELPDTIVHYEQPAAGEPEPTTPNAVVTLTDINDKGWLRLPKYYDDGTRINYTVVESRVLYTPEGGEPIEISNIGDFFDVTTTSNSGDTQSQGITGIGFTIDNKPKTTTIHVTKRWTLNGVTVAPPEGKEIITFRVFRTGSSQPITLTEANTSADRDERVPGEIHYIEADDDLPAGWQTITVTGLPKYEVQYTPATDTEPASVTYVPASYYVVENGDMEGVTVMYSVDGSEETDTPSGAATNDDEILIRNCESSVDVNILKVDAEDGETKLPNAEFQILKHDGNSYAAYNYATNTIVVDGGEDHSKLSTNAEGTLQFAGLTDGRYKLVETKAPRGYIKDKNNDIYFSIHDGKVTWTDENGDKITQQTVNQISYKDATKTFEVANTHGAALPHTGGPGTSFFYLIGCILTMLAGAGLVMRRRRREAA